MEITLTISQLKRSQLTPDETVLLYLLYYKKFDDIRDIYGTTRAVELRNKLVGTKYLLSDETLKFRDTLISNKNIEKLFGIRSDQINFWEFYNSYPIRVGSRVLRSAGDSTQIAEKHKKKYLARVKTIEAHNKAVASLNAFVAKQRMASKLNYLPNMETVMNNAMWEQWEVFIEEQGKEEQEWNTETI